MRIRKTTERRNAEICNKKKKTTQQFRENAPKKNGRVEVKTRKQLMMDTIFANLQPFYE